MNTAVQVQIVPRTIPASEQTIAERQTTVARLSALGLLEGAAAGEVSTTETAWSARIGGAEFPLAAFGVEPDSTGTVLVSLVVEAGSVQIGNEALPAEQQPAKPTVMWGSTAGGLA